MHVLFAVGSRALERPVDRPALGDIVFDDHHDIRHPGGDPRDIRPTSYAVADQAACAVPVPGVGAREGGDELDRRRTAEVRRRNEAEPGRGDVVDPALELMSSYYNRHMP